MTRKDKQFEITGWPAVPLILAVLLGVVDVLERMIEAVT
jgi:hypothetical protein